MATVVGVARSRDFARLETTEFCGSYRLVYRPPISRRWRTTENNA